MKQTAVEWLLDNLITEPYSELDFKHNKECWDKAKEMEKKQIFKAKNVSAKEAYIAGQHSMYCGCYDIDGCTNYEEWLYKQFKSDQ